MRKFSLNAKISFVVLVLIVANFTIALMAFDKMSEINQSLGSITSVVVPRMSEGEALRDIMRRLAVAERTLIAEDTKEGAARATKDIGDLSDLFLIQWNQVYRGAAVQGKEKLLKAKELFAKWKESSQETQNLVQQGHANAAIALANDKGRTAMQALQSEISQLVDMNKRVMDEVTVQTDIEYAKARGVLTTVAVGAILFGIALAFFFLRAVSRSINRVIDRLNANTGHVTLAAQQIAMSSKGLSDSTTQQAISLDRTTSKVREMNETVKRNADTARRTCEISLFSENAAKKGKHVVAQMISAISEINTANHNIMKQISESNEQIAQIVKMIGEIGDKTKVINDIVFQTKLLSFNASVEAARAGEHGKGFAVVAEEVRNLAQMSGNAARDITFMLDGSIQKVENIVKETQEKVERLVVEGNAKVEAGTRVANQCGSVLDEIVLNVGSVNQMALDISNASDEQAAGIEEVFKTVKKLEEVTQENAAVSIEAAKVGEELTDEAKVLRAIVGILVRTIKGGRGADPVLPAAKVEAAWTYPEMRAETGEMKQSRSGEPVSVQTANADETDVDPGNVIELDAQRKKSDGVPLNIAVVSTEATDEPDVSLGVTVGIPEKNEVVTSTTTSIANTGG
ncbi:MAG: MCP four helix bundle domain-containing protein [Deltaproteobacteria bacterium]|nr:MCP four helix bundle domain-containing protein [Deltaproteobacteria bacterium]